jgi:hypothetical protein
LVSSERILSAEKDISKPDMLSCSLVLLFQVAKIETEKMLISMVETELEKRKAEGRYSAHFRGQAHFFG